MSLKQLITIIATATIICWLLWLVVITQINPSEAETVGFLLFYITLFFALLGTFFMASFFWRRKFGKKTIAERTVAISFRQSIFFALIVTGVLFLQGKGLLNILNIVLIIIAVSVIEWFFLSIKRKA